MIHIMLIEDDEDDVLIFEELISDYTDLFEVTHFKSPEEAMAAIQANRFDICFTDYYLGSSNGLEVVTALLKKGYLGPIVLMTGAKYSERIDEEALLAGADDYLSKAELSPNLLKRTILYCIGRKKSENIRRASENRYRQMTEISTSTLHNIGNVLNTLHISSQAMDKLLHQIETNNLDKLANLLEEKQLLKDHPKAKMIPGYLRDMREAITENTETLRSSIRDSLERLKIAEQAIHVQQKTAKSRSEAASLSEIVSEAIALHRGILLREHVECAVVGANLFTSFDRASLLHILINLIKNAIEALHRVTSKKIRVDVFHEQGNVCIRVSDSGAGMTPEVIDQLFNHGFSTKKNGNGFGLHFCRQVLTNAGGSIHAHSEGPGRGAYFQITLPAKYEVGSL